MVVTGDGDLKERKWGIELSQTTKQTKQEAAATCREGTQENDNLEERHVELGTGP